MCSEGTTCGAERWNLGQPSARQVPGSMYHLPALGTGPWAWERVLYATSETLFKETWSIYQTPSEGKPTLSVRLDKLLPMLPPALLFCSLVIWAQSFHWTNIYWAPAGCHSLSIEHLLSITSGLHSLTSLATYSCCPWFLQIPACHRHKPLTVLPPQTCNFALFMSYCFCCSEVELLDPWMKPLVILAKLLEWYRC